MSDERRIISPVAKILLTAADFIEARGWCQGTMEDAQGRICPRQAIYYAEPGDRKKRHDASLMVARHLGLYFPSGLMVWNDEPGRTKTEVVSSLRAAAL
jgi:hypothetical protein